MDPYETRPPPPPFTPSPFRERRANALASRLVTAELLLRLRNRSAVLRRAHVIALVRDATGLVKQVLND